ncbi:MAG TPA: DnaJ C-terminal domain-containing protein [Kofleriaceae bacterium]|nr:DnaJ C-terminal domain-containing protein [Kofleriaceae bacterium]
MADSLYDALGVPKTADADAIRKAYRKLARKHHPDVNPGDKKAEEAFKKVSAAYEVLSDEKKRAAYDEFGDAALASGFDPDKARAYQQWQDTRQRRAAYDQGPVEFDLGDLGNLGDLFGRARSGPRPGSDLHATVQMELRQAVEGAEVALDVPGHGTVRVRIPPGADTGSIIRLAGKGAPGQRGGPAGDLVIEMEVVPHPILRREGLDLTMTVPVTLDEAYNGGSIEVPTFDGPVNLKVPPRSQNGARLRLRGKGIKRKDVRGDLYVELAVRMPDKPDDALAEALKASAGAYGVPVRAELRL